MNEFYLFEVADGDSKIKGKGVYDYATENEAIANYHAKIGVAMKSELYTEQTIVVLNREGKTIARNHYIAPVKVAE